MQIWEDKGSKKARLTELEIGEGGGKRKSGEHSVMRSNTGMGVRAMYKNKERRVSCTQNFSRSGRSSRAGGWQACMWTEMTSSWILRTN